jgi:hypothetical protein
MFDYRQWMLENLEIVVLTLIGLLVLALFFFVLNTVRLNQLHRRYRLLMKGVDKGNLEELLFKQAEQIKELAHYVKEVKDSQHQIDQELQTSIGPITRWPF